MSTNGRRPELGRLESAVLAVVAASPEPVTVAQVQTQLPADPAYTTVMSTLARLAKKGALRQIRDGRAYRYEPAAPAGSIDDALTAAQRPGKSASSQRAKAAPPRSGTASRGKA